MEYDIGFHVAKSTVDVKYAVRQNGIAIAWTKTRMAAELIIACLQDAELKNE